MSIDDFILNFQGQLDDFELGNLIPETEFKTLDDWDSFTALSIIAMIDEVYGVKIAAKDLVHS